MSIGIKARKRLVELFNMNLSGSSEEAQALKEEAHALARRILRDFGQRALGLDRNRFTVRTNMGGTAVAGETSLHTDPFGPHGGVYVLIGIPMTDGRVLFRAVTDRKDHCGRANHWTTVVNAFGNEPNEREFCDTVKSLVSPVSV